MAARVSAAVLLLALVAAVSEAKLVFEETFDVHPKKKDDILEFEFFAKDGYWSNKLVTCPGGRDSVSPDYDQCLDMRLERCKNKNYPDKGGCFRNEIGLLDEPDIFKGGDEHWIGMSLWVPKDYKPDRLKTVNIQVKANGGADFSPSGPNFSLVNINGLWGVSIRASGKCKNKCEIDTAVFEFFATVVPGAWVDFVYHTRFTNDPSKGFGTMYMNGVQVFDVQNVRTTYNTNYGLFIKWGVYKHQWGEGDLDEFFDKDVDEIIVAAFRVAEGPDAYDEADTSPSRHCSSPEECCTPCVDGKENLLFSKRRCEKMCSESPSAEPCVQRIGSCGSHKKCCNKCIKKQPNWRYDPDSCLGKCNTELKRASPRSRKLKLCPIRSMVGGCKNKANPLQCEEGCDQSAHSFHCTCKDKDYHISNKWGNVCQEIKKDLKDEPPFSDFPLVG